MEVPGLRYDPSQTYDYYELRTDGDFTLVQIGQLAGAHAGAVVQVANLPTVGLVSSGEDGMVKIWNVSVASAELQLLGSFGPFEWPVSEFVEVKMGASVGIACAHQADVIVYTSNRTHPSSKSKWE